MTREVEILTRSAIALAPTAPPPSQRKSRPMDEFEARLTYLRWWWERHGSTAIFTTADEWINSLTNVELLEVLSWAKHD
jgi:hypothetical protein